MNNYEGRDPLKRRDSRLRQNPHGHKPHTDDRTQTPDMEMMEMQPLGVSVERERNHGMGYSGEEPVQSYPVEDDSDSDSGIDP